MLACECLVMPKSLVHVYIMTILLILDDTSWTLSTKCLVRKCTASECIIVLIFCVSTPIKPIPNQ